MSPFNDRFRDQLRRNRLLGLRAALLSGAFVAHERFATVFTWTDFATVEGHLYDFHRITHKLAHPSDWLSAGLRDFMQRSWQPPRDLRLVHEQWGMLKADRYTNPEILEKRFANLRAEHRRIMSEIKYLNAYRKQLTWSELYYLRDPSLEPDFPIKSSLKGIKTMHDFCRRFPWTLKWRDTEELFGLPHFSLVERLVFLWRIEHHLGMPPWRQDQYNWVPHTVIGPNTKISKRYTF